MDAMQRKSQDKFNFDLLTQSSFAKLYLWRVHAYLAPTIYQCM